MNILKRGIEHMSYLNSRYGGQHGWKLSSRFETALKQLAAKSVGFRDTKTGSKEKELMLIEFANSRRTVGSSNNQVSCPTKKDIGENIQ
jgi:hypothetical protein